jgi:hypothetical protein
LVDEGGSNARCPVGRKHGATCDAAARMTALALAVGCEFEFESTQAVASVV